MNRFLLDTLMQLGVHVGNPKTVCNNKTTSFILGARHQYNIIDIRYTVSYLNKALSFLKNVGSLQGALLFYSGSLASSNSYTKLYCLTLLDSTPHSIFDEKWSFGQLSNFKVQAQRILYKLFYIQNMQKKKRITKQQLYFMNLRWLDLLTRLVFYTYFKQITGVSWELHFQSVLKYWRFFIFFKFFKNLLLLPDVLILINPQNYKSPSLEATVLKIPVISLVDTDTNTTGITYPIPSNDDSLLISVFFFRLFINAYNVGRYIIKI